MGKERKYISCGDGECQFANRCANYNSSECYVCMYNTAATPRDFFRARPDCNELTEQEIDMIES